MNPREALFGENPIHTAIHMQHVLFGSFLEGKLSNITIA
jgi:hypothetical protein